MSPVSIEFPLPRRDTPFGPISDPTIPVAGRTLNGDRTRAFLIDTGADLSVAPRYLARQVGLDWGALVPVSIMGIERAGVTGRLGELPISLAGINFALRCLSLDVPLAREPFLLGRADFLDRFVLTLDALRGRIVLTKIP